MNTVSVTDEEGLSQTNNEFVYKDSYGWVWISSLDGVNLYNGRSIRLFRPDANDPERTVCGSNTQSPFFEDPEGNIWFSTESALNCFVRKTGRFRHFFLDINHQPSDSPKRHYAFFLEGGRFLWIEADDKLIRFDIRTETRNVMHGLSAGRCAIETMPDGSVKKLINCFWSLGKGMEIVEYDARLNPVRRDTFFNVSSPLNKMPALTIRQAIVMPTSDIWAASDGGLLEIKAAGAYDLIPPPTGVSVRRVYPKDRQNLWMVSNDGFISEFDTRSRTFNTAFYNTDSLGDALFVWLDRQNVLWRSVKGFGVLHNKLIDNPLFQAYNIATGGGIKSVVHLFESRPGRVACLNAKGEGQLLNESGHVLKNLKLPAYTHFCRGSDGLVYFVSQNLFGRYDFDSDHTAVLWEEPQAGLFDLISDRKGNFLLAAGNGLRQISLNGLNNRIVPGINTGITMMHLDRGDNLWFVTMKDKLECRHYDGNDVSAPLYQTSFTGQFHQIIEDTIRRVIWVGLDKGLLRLSLKNGKWEELLISEADGLPNQFIYAITFDKRNNLWLSTNRGIVKYMPENPSQTRFKHYTMRNGLNNNEYCPQAVLTDQSGQIWFGGVHGVAVFNPDSIRDLGTAPQLALAGLKVHDDEWHNDSVSVEMVRKIDLEYDQNTLRFELAAMEYTDPEMNKFRVWLSKNGARPDTVELGTQNFITYANLAPGRYVFAFTACNNEGIWQQTPYTLEFVIHPPYWETWWFKLLIVSLVLGFVGFGTAFYYRYRLRVQQLELERRQREADRKQLLLENELALQLERNRIADEMHDELGGGLSTIRLASERAKKMQSAEDLKHILTRVSQISIDLIGNMRGIIWAMDTQNDSLDSLLSYLRQYARNMMDDNGIEAQIRIPSEVPAQTLNGQYRHSVMLTVKECLNNIVKHAEATSVKLNVSLSENELQIEIRDNGIGFDPNERARSGKGLRTTAKRMESVGGSIHWQRNPEGGMTAVLTAPL